MADRDLAQLPAYNTVDFQDLAQNDEAFAKIYHKSAGKLDFQDPDTVRALTKAELKCDFGLEIDLPDDRLCPPVPNRWNYVAWIQNLIDSTSPNYDGNYDPDREVVGLDIGTGASAIYTLLCLRSRPNWTMCATDIDKKSFESAARNLALNALIQRTKLLQTSQLDALIPLQALGVEKLHFTICNPPFFTDELDMRKSLKGEGKSWTPNAVCTGAPVEMVAEPGGDLGFVTALVEESLKLRERVTWYSSLFGKLSSAKAVISLLKQHGVTNWAVGVIEVGSPTKRWVVAWSFGDLRPRNDIARAPNIPHEFLPFPTEYKITVSSPHTLETATSTLNTQLSSLNLIWAWHPETSTGIGTAKLNVWSRAYRRAHQRQMKEREEAGGNDVAMDDERGDGVEDSVALAFRVRVIEEKLEDKEIRKHNAHKVVIVLEWLKGSDQVLWESFCGMVNRCFKQG